ncbi:hypothetical protein EH240_14580 [Mesorhizobium tamadayense]|uniref:Uncharacterized protein n=1 Tax=Mesorhizobium tamadayense TaxID=425306 RepID=A0A3P3FSD0_9HYPH|nr:hypothetical protein [Mesorhizobium tamadayense]RRI01516.1 hypothetical protein EH240_14580 [Mesorhizobium tamadayense]
MFEAARPQLTRLLKPRLRQAHDHRQIVLLWIGKRQVTPRVKHRSQSLTDVFDKGRSALGSVALRHSVPTGGRDSVARSKVRAGRQAIARYARLGLDGASTSLSFAATGWNGEADFATLSRLG